MESTVAVVIAIVVVVVGVVVSVVLHELGHMVPAKRFGVRVSQFMVGFGPTLWSRRRGETEYGFKAIPAGGYVRMVGMYPPAPEGARTGNGFFSQVIADTREASVEEIHDGEESRAFYNLSAPKKIVVMLGGPFMNLVVAFVLMMVIFVGFGAAITTTKVAVVTPCVQPSLTTETKPCQPGDPQSPAVAAGLTVGDTVVSFDGHPVEKWEQLTDLIADSDGSSVPMVVEREGQQVTLTVTPATVERQVLDKKNKPVVDSAGEPVTETGHYVGFTPLREREPQSPAFAAEQTWNTVTATAGMVATLPVRVFEVARSAFTDEPRDPNSVMSIVGFGRVAVDVAESESPLTDQLITYLGLVAALNIALFLFNLIPLLPLDGGHVVNALYEGAKRARAKVRGLPRPGPADLARMMPVGYVMFVVLVVVGALLIVADIVDPVRIT